MGEKHRELLAAKSRISDLEGDAERHAEAYATIVHKMKAAKAAAEYDRKKRSEAAPAAAKSPIAAKPSREAAGKGGGAGGGGGGGPGSQKVGLHKLTHLKCAVLEYIRTDPEETSRREQLTRMISTLLHFSVKETESALAIARQRPSDSDPLAFLGSMF